MIVAMRRQIGNILN